MPRLVDPQATERPVPRPPGGIVRLADTGPGDVGRGISSLGQGLQAGEEEIYRIQKIEEDRVNGLVAEDAFTKLRERQLDLSMGKENGFMQQKGSAAVTRPIFKEWTQRFDDAQKEVGASLTNNHQRERFATKANMARLQYQEEILRHLSQQGEVYAKEVYDGTVAVEQRNAVSRWDSPNDVGISLERIRHAVDERADTNHWPPEYRDAAMKMEQGKVHSAVVQEAIHSGNYRYAQEWYNQHREDIDLTTAKQLETAVKDGAQKDLMNGYTADYLADQDDSKALGALRNKVLTDQGLHEDRKNILVGRIQNREYVLERRQEVQEERRLRHIERGVSELNANTLAGFEPSQDQFAPLLEAAKGTELESQVHQAIDLANATRSFRNMPPLQQEQTLTTVEAGIRTEPTKFDRRVVNAWRSIFDAQRRQATESPVGFAVQQGIITPPQPLDLSKPEAMTDALTERLSIARGMSSRYQVPFKPLTPEEVKLLSTTLNQATVEQKRNYLGSLSNATGKDTEGFIAIMSQLAPDDPVTAIAGSQAARGRNAEADLMLRGQAILRPATKSDGKPDTGHLLPMPKETDMRLAFDNYVREAFAGKPEARSAHYQAAKAAYAAISVDAGDKDTEVFNKDRWKQAMGAALGQVEEYNSRRVVLPTGYDYSQFRDETRARITDAVGQGGLDPSWTEGRLRDLPLESIGDGRYVFRSGDKVVVDKGGRPVILDFNEHFGARSSSGVISRPGPREPMIEPQLIAPPSLDPVPPELQRLRDEKRAQMLQAELKADPTNEALKREIAFDEDRRRKQAAAPAAAPPLPPSGSMGPESMSASEEQAAWTSRFSPKYLEGEKRLRELRQQSLDAARKRKRTPNP